MKLRYVQSIALTAVAVFLLSGTAFAAGQVLERSEYWPDGKVRITRKYYKTGEVASVNYYGQDGTLEQRQTQDPSGNKTSESYYNSDGSLREGANGWAAMTWKYNNGQIAEESYYGADGRLTERKQYNSLGDLAARQYVGDGNLDPSEEFNPAPTLSGETNTYYDSEDRREGSTSAEIW